MTVEPSPVTAATRPTAADPGTLVHERDTGRVLRWTGRDWVDDLPGWLSVQLDEAEQLARAATSGPWWDSPVLAAPGYHTIRGGPRSWRGFDGSLGGDTRPVARIEPAPDCEGSFVTNHDADAEFIARWDPARAVREVQANRRILARHAPRDHLCPDPIDRDGYIWFEAGEERRADIPCGDLRDLAAPYSDRPGFAEEWRP
jgi:hypothetical protein